MLTFDLYIILKHLSSQKFSVIKLLIRFSQIDIKLFVLITLKEWHQFIEQYLFNYLMILHRKTKNNIDKSLTR